MIRIDLGSSRWSTLSNLLYQCDTPVGSQWFVARNNGIVRNLNGQWTMYGIEDGTMDAPQSIYVTREETVWAAGSHQNSASTARFDGKRWRHWTHPDLSWSVHLWGGFQDRDGDLWFGSTVDNLSELGHRGGVLRFDG